MISVKNIRIPQNYVLAAVEKDYTTYQRGGVDLNILVADYVYQDGKRISRPNLNYAVFGKVFGVPEKINFHRDEIACINRNHTIVGKDKEGQHKVVHGDLLHRINDLKKHSCKFETENELEVGDTVKFSYMVHIKAQEEGSIFDTEEGKMFFIKYDDIYMSVDENNKPKRMVNGYILVDPNTIETKKEGGVEYEEANHGLVIPKMYEVSKQKRGKKCMEGKVVLAGKPLGVTENGIERLGGYFEQEGYYEPDIEVKIGDRLLFDPRTAMQIEHDNHQALFDHRLYIIQRKDIIFMENNNPNFESIGLDKVNYETA
jgi:hypothetical protein